MTAGTFPGEIPDQTIIETSCGMYFLHHMTGQLCTRHFRFNPVLAHTSNSNADGTKTWQYIERQSIHIPFSVA